MATTKSEYHVNFTCAPEAVTAIIENWLAANEFTKVDKGEGINYYFFNDPILKGKRSLEYYIKENQIIIYAYVGTYEKGQELEGIAGCAGKIPYRNDLESLFNALNTVSDKENTYDFETIHKQSQKKEVTIAFVISLVALLAALFGFIIGWFFVLIAILMAVKGLKSERRGLAIASIVISALALMLDVAMLTQYMF